eukprot:2070463-Rhodomonas_salina.1
MSHISKFQTTVTLSSTAFTTVFEVLPKLQQPRRPLSSGSLAGSLAGFKAHWPVESWFLDQIASQKQYHTLCSQRLWGQKQG